MHYTPSLPGALNPSAIRLVENLVFVHSLPFLERDYDVPRLRDTELQLATIRAAEPSLSHSHFDVIREIIYLRRRIDPVVHMARFRLLLNEGGEDLLRAFSTRWLVSIADTYADHGADSERANAMIIVMLANVTKLAETERLYLKDVGIDPKRQGECIMAGTPLWDGMVSYAIKHGDMPINMWMRVRAILVDTPTLSSIFETVLSRMLAGNTVIGRLAPLNSNFHQLVEPFPHWEIVDGCA